MSANIHSPLTAGSVGRVSRLVVCSQLLFSAGNVLTTGGFLYYYANEAFEMSALQFAVLLVLPELMETAGVLARPTIVRFGSRKTTWLTCFLLARVFALGVPLTALALLKTGRVWPFEVLVGWVAGWYVLQGIAYAAYISWLSDLVPQESWGRLFARRKVAMLGIMIVLPVVVGLLKRRWDQSLPDDERLIVYVVVFLVGTVLLLASVLPLLRLPDVPLRLASGGAGVSTWSVFRGAWSDRPFRWLLLHGWWLAFFQGLTQAAFYRYSVGVLHVPVEIYYVMSGLMLSLQIPSTWHAGRLSDAGRDRSTLLWSVTGVSGALFFWLAATPARWWLLFGAYALWGLFGYVNICGRNLVLKLAPESDNALHLSLFRQVGGFVAAVAGLIGGWWLDRLLADVGTEGSPGRLQMFGVEWGGFQCIFLVSFLGRVTAGLWLLPIRGSDARRPVRNLEPAGPGVDHDTQ